MLHEIGRRAVVDPMAVHGRDLLARNVHEFEVLRNEHAGHGDRVIVSPAAMIPR